MKKRIKSLVASSLALVIMLSCCIAVYASSYTTMVSFQGEHEGAVREFDGQNIRYTATTYSSMPEYINKVYFVSLYRKKLIGASLIGKSDELPRDGSAKVEWSNVGEGKYYLYFTKARDGINVRSDNVVIKNY